MAWFYHNWESDGTEIAIEIPDMGSGNIPHCGDNTGSLDVNDAIPHAIGSTWQIQVENGATMSPAVSQLEQLHDMWVYLTDACMLANNYVSYCDISFTKLNDCMVSCADYNNLFRWCSNSSTFGRNSMQELYYLKVGWANAYQNATRWLETMLEAQQEAEDAWRSEQGYIATNTQIDMMKANLQITLANAQGAVNEVETRARMDKLKVIFLPVMAILLIVLLIWFLVGDDKKSSE